jgi:hypothetical protein
VSAVAASKTFFMCRSSQVLDVLAAILVDRPHRQKPLPHAPPATIGLSGGPAYKSSKSPRIDVSGSEKEPRYA